MENIIIINFTYGRKCSILKLLGEKLKKAATGSDYEEKRNCFDTLLHSDAGCEDPL